MLKFTVEFTVPASEYRGSLEECRRQFVADLQALLYDNGEGGTCDAIAGQFDVVAESVA